MTDEKLYDILRVLTDTCTRLSAIVEQQNSALQDHETRMRELERKPRIYWKTVLTAVVSGIVTSLCTYFIAHFIGGGLL